jgi:predicted ATPase/signal transduction histidine kinase/tRNA A-37 threonylcarbamoyl transferase component Bud32
MGIIILESGKYIVQVLVAMIQLAGYKTIEQIYSSTKTLVYRGIRESDQKAVVIKLLRQEYPRFNELVQFRNQYTIAKNLDFPGIIQTYSLENYHNGYALVMEDFGGISLKDYLTTDTDDEDVETLHATSLHLGISLQKFFHIAIQIVSTLNELHRSHIIHKDIKPANILINPTTLQVKIIDFSIASALPKETQTPTNPNVLEGTLAYMSPEQTARMNRGVDYRSDFYSLGVTFFELLTGKLPFFSDDVMELVHSHLAKIPPQAHSFNPHIPPILSEIISKLMAKNAENRYQSALGIEYDLQFCQQQWEQTSNITFFELGSKDISTRFLIPEKLYGREMEVKTLLSAYERVSAGSSEIMLVAGFSGIGKTAIVNEVHKPIVRQHGYFIKGKYDQLGRNIPFSALLQAFRDLMGQILCESDAQLQLWKTKILAALGDNAQVIIDVIPELERIIGQQPPVLELSGSAAQNRFNLLFQKFIQIFTTKEHPLVIFLDDLQWADSASLKLMQLLITESHTGYLLLIGAYRDNEVSSLHPLVLTLDDIQKTGAVINTIVLAPLNQTDLNHLVADTLNCTEELALPLNDILYHKTKGNPFFSHQFLKSLHEDGLISFNFNSRCWECDITQVSSLALTDDVVDFMALQLQKLPRATQEVLKLAACIGNQFNLETLSIVYEKSQADTAAELWKALQFGLILPITQLYKFFQDETTDSQSPSIKPQIPISINNEQLTINYKFLHDRVQQAAYFLIPEEKKQYTHLKIGRLLLQNTEEAAREEKIFEIVNQLNVGVELISNYSEKIELVQLNLIAGCKAKASTAYAAAVGYLTMGMKLLAAHSWQSQYNLTFALYLEAIEAECLNARFESAANLAETALQNCQTILDRIAIYQLKILFFTAQNQMPTALATGLEALDLMGVSLIAAPSKSDAIALVPHFEDEDIQALPIMTDSHYLAAMKILMTVIPAAFMVCATTYSRVIVTMIHLCHQYGYSSIAASAYSQYGLVLSGVMGEIEAGYHSALVALKLLELFHANELKCKVYLLVYGFIKPWKEKFTGSLTPLLEGLQSGMETGDIEFAGYCTFHYCDKAFGAGEVLDVIADKLVSFIELMEKFKQEFSLFYNKVWHQLILNLLGEAKDKYRLVGDSFDESVLLPYFHHTKNGTLLFVTYVAKLILLYFFQDYGLAIESAHSAIEFAPSGSGMIATAYHNFYYSLALLAHYPHVDTQQQTEYITLVEEQQKTMQLWSNHAPMNFLNKFYLVAAEKHRVTGEYTAAIEAYDYAIALAKENEYLHEEALAKELAGKFYLEWGKQRIAQTYLTDAYYSYGRWGAKAKVEDLEKRYSRLLLPIGQLEKTHPTTNNTISSSGDTFLPIHDTIETNSSKSTTVEVLDLATIIKASQTLSGEIHLDKLLSKLMQVVMENAGAERGSLILPKSQNLEIAVECLDSQQCDLRFIPVASADKLPLNIINYVSRTLETLVMSDASTHTDFAGDSYIIHQQPKSLLCTPILNQGKLLAILYLENNQCIGAFTSQRLEILRLLCSQAAISLENAILYEQLEDYSHNLEIKVEERTKELKAAQKQIIAQEKLASLGLLTAGVAHEIRNPLNFVNNFAALSVNLAQELAEEIETQYERLEADTVEYIKEILSDLVGNVTEIQKQGERADSIIQNMLLLSRSDTKGQRQLSDINALVGEGLQLAYHSLRNKYNDFNIAIETDYDSELGEVAVVAQDLCRALINIIDNACYAAHQKKKTLGDDFVPRLTIATQNQGDSLLISIKDNGQGIPPDFLDKIFTPFFTTKPTGEGTGLGLSLTHDIIVGQHHGEINVHTEVGEYTEFVLSLPKKVLENTDS